MATAPSSCSAFSAGSNFALERFGNFFHRDESYGYFGVGAQV